MLVSCCRDCEANSCRNIVDECVANENDSDLDQDLYSTICKYAVIGLAGLNILREVRSLLWV